MSLNPVPLISIAVISIGIGASAGCGNNSRDTVSTVDGLTHEQYARRVDVRQRMRERSNKIYERQRRKMRHDSLQVALQIQPPGDFIPRPYHSSKIITPQMWRKIEAIRRKEWEKVQDIRRKRSNPGSSRDLNVGPEDSNPAIVSTSDQTGEEFSLSRDAAMKAFQQRRAAYLSKVAKEGRTPEIKAELRTLQRERNILLQKYFQKGNDGVIVPQRDLRSVAPQDHLQSKKAVDIDSWVDEQVEKHWRPLPGGNSKEDAKRISKDVLKAKTWEELQQVMEYHHSKGR